jgi:hypothetical protein
MTKDEWPRRVVYDPRSPITKDQLDYWMAFIDRQQAHFRQKAADFKFAVVYCGCSDDWALIDPTVTPDEHDSGRYAHGFDSEQEALDYIEAVKSGLPGLSYWVPAEVLTEWQRRKRQ